MLSFVQNTPPMNSPYRFFPSIFVFLFLVTQVTIAQTPSPVPQSALTSSTDDGSILHKIETYKAPPYPNSGFISKETYDYRIESNTPVPPTLTDAFICDIWQRIKMDLKKTDLNPFKVDEETVMKAFDVYLKTGWSDIAGYRPWTLWNFIRGLSDEERKKLAGEVVAYMSVNGVKDVPQ